MIRSYVNLLDVILGFEGTLKIEYSSKDVRKIRKNSIEQLERIFHVKLDKSIYEVQIDNKYVSEDIDVLLSQITENLKSLALLNSISMYDKQYGKTLSDVKYLGYAKDNLLAALQFLQDDDLYKRRDEFFESLIDGTDTIFMCPIKKLLIIMIILEKLGVEEGVALIAQYLYVGGLEI